MLFLMLTKVTAEGSKTLKANPHRIKEVNKEVESMGAKIKAQYALLGPYDFATVLEAPDAKVISKIAIELSARGTLQTMTMVAIDLDEFAQNL